MPFPPVTDAIHSGAESRILRRLFLSNGRSRPRSFDAGLLAAVLVRFVSLHIKGEFHARFLS